MKDMMNTPISKIMDWWRDKDIEVLVLDKDRTPQMAYDCSGLWEEDQKEEWKEQVYKKYDSKIPNCLMKNIDWDQAYEDDEYKSDDLYIVIDDVEEMIKDFPEHWLKNLWEMIELEMVVLK